MKPYNCFFSRIVGEIPEFVVLSAESDVQVCIKAGDFLLEHPNYASVEIFADNRVIRRIERTA